MTSFGMEFAPLMPWPLLAGLALVALLALGAAAASRAPGTAWRVLAAAAILAALANPALVEEKREKLRDVVALVIDDTPSQAIGARRAQIADAETAIRGKLAAFGDSLEVRTVTLRHESAAASGEGTLAIGPLTRLLADVPPRRIAGAILLTDGQIHDIPADAAAAGLPVPLHVLLAGEKGGRDRRLTVVQAPGYGIVGSPVTLTVRVDDLGAPAVGAAVVTLRWPDGSTQEIAAAIGEDTPMPVTVAHAGPTVLELSVEGGPDELTLANNRAVIEINGVRDRLRVLLVSGEPHPGERTWRNLLKSDPSVDLVHFTILRPPEKQDGTPIQELSLIAFPTRELFEVKLHEFDLVIFDRYRRRGVLPPAYLQNVVDYVMAGGALLEASGPLLADAYSLYRTPLGAVLPGEPTGAVIERGFRPEITEIGQRHPVTADLPGSGDGAAEPGWGRWLRQVEVEAHRGQVAMSGADGKPLLILDRVGLGRVAQLNSDQIWLWARGFEGGGPQAELLRRLAHWLMQEPDLEENSLTASVQGDTLAIERRSVEKDDPPVELTRPGGAPEKLTLTETRPGLYVATIPVSEAGLYRVSDGQHVALAAVGPLNPREYADMRASDTVPAPLTQATGGALRWLSDGLPDIRRVQPGRRLAGRDWIGLVANDDYLVTGMRQIPALPAILALILALGAALAAWRREGR